MKKKILKQDLLNHGFVLASKGRLVKKFGDLELSIGLDASFGKVFMINIYYNFKNELPFDKELLGNIWEKGLVAINDNIEGLELGALYTGFICGIVRKEEILKDINGETIEHYCEQFIDAIEPIIKEYEL